MLSLLIRMNIRIIFDSYIIFASPKGCISICIKSVTQRLGVRGFHYHVHFCAMDAFQKEFFYFHLSF